MSTRRRGRIVWISASSHGLQAADLPAVRLLVQAPLAPAHPAEVLDGVGHVDAAARDAGGLQALVEDAAGGSDERLALDVLAVAGLLADQHHRGLPRAVAEHGLRRVLPEIAAAAAIGGLAQRVEGHLLRQELLGAHELRTR